MDVITSLDGLTGRFAKTAVALGTFDGVHVGHQRIISQAVALARESGATGVVFTFGNHPLSVIAPDRCPPLIVSPEYKAELIAGLGADVLLSIPFTADFLQLTPRQFIDLLVERLRPAFLVVGDNYSFGHRGAGNPELLRQAGRELGYEVIIPPTVLVDDQPVSSTLIRQHILAGRVGEAARFLGRPFRLSGVVTAGDGRGRTLGFPTANLVATGEQIIPADGVYAVLVQAGGQSYQGVANIGANPTFNGLSHRTEVHVFDFSGDLYDRTITVDFMARLRGEESFAGPEKLREQISRDVVAAREILSFI
jgi:riboflavin kinase/FMN adenylyltransferase